MKVSLLFLWVRIGCCLVSHRVISCLFVDPLEYRPARLVGIYAVVMASFESRNWYLYLDAIPLPNVPIRLALSAGPGIIETPRRVFSDFQVDHRALAPSLRIFCLIVARIKLSITNN